MPPVRKRNYSKVYTRFLQVVTNSSVNFVIPSDSLLIRFQLQVFSTWLNATGGDCYAQVLRNSAALVGAGDPRLIGMIWLCQPAAVAPTATCSESQQFEMGILLSRGETLYLFGGISTNVLGACTCTFLLEELT